MSEKIVALERGKNVMIMTQSLKSNLLILKISIKPN